jgi:transcriptional regulator with XRE-family HTH domain
MSVPRIKTETRAYFRALGAHIGELRKEQGMTQAELARALGVSQQTVFAYELGDRRVSVLILIKLARIFDVSLEQLSGMSSRFGHPICACLQRVCGMRSVIRSCAGRSSVSSRRSSTLCWSRWSRKRQLLPLTDRAAQRHNGPGARGRGSSFVRHWRSSVDSSRTHIGQ